MDGLEVSIVTVSDIFQDEARSKSRFSDEYKNQSAQIILDKQDMTALGARDGQRLLVKNDVGSVVVVARPSQDAHPGLAFMYNSPWSNQLASDLAESNLACFCVFKRIKAAVQPADASVAAVTEISEIFSRMKG